jgi:hypothetical protein
MTWVSSLCWPPLTRYGCTFHHRVVFLHWHLWASVTVAIDFQWTGVAPSGCGDLVYFFCSDVEFEVLASSFDELKTEYLACLNRALHRGEDCVTVERFEDDFALEFVELFTTIVPQLFGGLTPEEAASNKDRFGFLSCEFDPRIIAWMCDMAVRCFRHITSRGLLVEHSCRE